MKDVKFEIEGVEYKLPEFINIEDYVKIFKIKDILSEDYFAAKLINIITGCPVEVLLEADFEKVNFLSSYIMTILPQPNPKFVNRFELDGVQYGFIPSWRKLSFAEYVDIDTLSSKDPMEILNYLHVLAAMYYRPIVKERSVHDFDIEKYSMDTLDQRAELFKKKLDAKVIMGAQFFFIKFAKKLLENSQQSSTMSLFARMRFALKYWRIIHKIVSKGDLDGTQSLIESHKMILQNTIKSTRKPWWKFSTNWSTLLPKIRRLQNNIKK
jgi:hypothetical protein